MITEKALARRIRKALDAALDEARSRGTKNPGIYFEAESMVIIDRDHPSWRDSDLHGAKLSVGTHAQDAIVLRLQGAYPPHTDMGGW